MHCLGLYLEWKEVPLEEPSFLQEQLMLNYRFHVPISLLTFMIVIIVIIFIAIVF